MNLRNISASNSPLILDSSYFTKEAQITITIFYVIATFVKFGANSLIWTIVLRNKRLQSPMNYLLLNLSLADIISGLTVYPYVFILDVGSIFDSPKQQARLCILTEGLSFFFVAAGASLLTLSAVSGNRFLAICYPTRQSLRMGRVSVLVFSIVTWIISISCILPGMLSFKYELKFKSCIRNWGRINRPVYRFYILFIGTVFPTLFLLASFSAIVVKSRQVIPIDDARSNGSRILQMRKAEKMLGVLIFVYLVCWLPFSTFWGLRSATNYFPRTVQGLRKSNRWMRTAVLCAILNGTLDPFVYILGSSDLKKAVRNTLKQVWLRITCQRDAPLTNSQCI